MRFSNLSLFFLFFLFFPSIQQSVHPLSDSGGSHYSHHFSQPLNISNTEEHSTTHNAYALIFHKSPQIMNLPYIPKFFTDCPANFTYSSLGSSPHLPHLPAWPAPAQSPRVCSTFNYSPATTPHTPPKSSPLHSLLLELCPWTCPAFPAPSPLTLVSNSVFLSPAH